MPESLSMPSALLATVPTWANSRLLSLIMKGMVDLALQLLMVGSVNFDIGLSNNKNFETDVGGNPGTEMCAIRPRTKALTIDSWQFNKDDEVAGTTAALRVSTMCTQYRKYFWEGASRWELDPDYFTTVEKAKCHNKVVLAKTRPNNYTVLS